MAESITDVNAAMNVNLANLSNLATIEQLQSQVLRLKNELAEEEDEVQCCPHCDHDECDGNCDFRCRKVAKREGCNGLTCGTQPCKINHRTHFAKASDLIDFEANGGKIGGDIVRVVR